MGQTLSYFDDVDFQVKILTFLCRERNFLRNCAYLLTPEDFKPKLRGDIPEFWIMATLALEFWAKYRQPIGGMISTEIQVYIKRSGLPKKTADALTNLGGLITAPDVDMSAVEAVEDQVIAYKKERLKAIAVQKLIDTQEAGELTDDLWLTTCYDAIQQFNDIRLPVEDYFDDQELENRIMRRAMHRSVRHPYFMIEPLDALVKSIPRGQIGLWLAPWKTGKSLALIWQSVSLVLQGLNVLFFTLEDPKDEVDDRLDASIASLPASNLEDWSDELRERFARFKRLLRKRLYVIDGTNADITVAKIAEVWERERARGFFADAVMIDYDDEVRPSQKYDQRRFEFAEIYRDLRKFAARSDTFVWTAAQTTRETEGRKIITGSDCAEDISKIRKVGMAVGIGQGDWGDDSRYLYVCAHKFDRKRIGCHIVCDLERTIFYDRTATAQAELRYMREDEGEVIE